MVNQEEVLLYGPVEMTGHADYHIDQNFDLDATCIRHQGDQLIDQHQVGLDEAYFGSLMSLLLLAARDHQVEMNSLVEYKEECFVGGHMDNFDHCSVATPDDSYVA